MKPFYWPPIAVALSCAGPVIADTVSEPDAAHTHPLATIVITADPFSRSSDQLIQPVEMLEGDALERARASSIGETLSQVPGITNSDFGRGAGRPVIRGQAGPRVQVLQNGLPTGDASDVSADHSVGLEPLQAQQVEILKGPATLLFGSGASAGVVNINDGRLNADPLDGIEARVGAAFNSVADEGSAHGSIDFGMGNTRLHLDAAWRDGDDYRAPLQGADKVANSAVETESGAFSIAHSGRMGSAALSLSAYDSSYGLPAEEAAFIDLEQRRADLDLVLRSPFDGWQSIRLRGGLSDYEHTEFEEPGEAGSQFFNDQTDVRVEFRHEPVGGLDGVFGVQRRDREFVVIGEEAYVPPTDTRGVGVFLIETLPTAFGAVELGVRWDRDSVEVQGQPASRREFTPFSAAGGVTIDLGSQDHLKLYLSSSERSPVAEELFAFGPHLATASFERGYRGSDKETTRSVELSLDRHGGPLGWHINLFHQWVSDYIFQQSVDTGLNADGSGAGVADGVADRVDEDGNFDPAGELLLLDYQQADARLWGAELELGLGWNMADFEIHARLFGDWVRGRLDDGGDLPRITPPRVGLGLHLHRGQWAADLSWLQVLEQDQVSALETETDDYTLLGLQLDYGLPLAGGELGLFLQGHNLLDEEALRHTSFIKDVAPLPGIGVSAGFEWRL